MSEAIVLTKEGEKVGELKLNPELFDVRVNQQLLALVQKAYAGNLRRGTHATKTRGEVRGGGKKPWKQKGTGRARHGSRRSPIWRGGGTVFGPHPRSYFTALPDGMKRKALISALSLKNKEQNLLLLQDCELKSHKTKEFAQVVKALKLENSKTLLIVNSESENLTRSSRNLKHLVAVKMARDVNAYHVLRRPKLLIEQGAISVLEARLLHDSNLDVKTNNSETEEKV